MSLFGGEEDWQPVAGYVPLLVAEHRLRNLRRVARRLLPIHGELIEELEREQVDYLAELTADPEFAEYEYEGQMISDDQIYVARDETPILLTGSLVAYGLSLLETALGDSAATVAAVRGVACPKNVRGPQLDGWHAFLASQHVHVAWGSVKKELDAWRKARNAYVHALELGHPAVADWPEDPAAWRVEEFIGVVEAALTALDEAMEQV